MLFRRSACYDVAVLSQELMMKTTRILSVLLLSLFIACDPGDHLGPVNQDLSGLQIFPPDNLLVHPLSDQYVASIGWSDETIGEIREVVGGDFEAVDTGAIITNKPKSFTDDSVASSLKTGK
jgi:hypothetical protein